MQGDLFILTTISRLFLEEQRKVSSSSLFLY